MSINFKYRKFFVSILLKSLVVILAQSCFANAVGVEVNKALVIPNTDTWVKVSNGLPKVFLNVLYSYNKLIFVGTHGRGIYKTEDGGTTWLPFNSDDLANAQIRVFYTRPESPEYLYIGTNKGVFRIKNPHLIPDMVKPLWEKVGKLGLKNKALTEPDRVGMFLDDVTTLVSYRNYLFAGTDGGGVFQIKDDEENWSWVEMGAINYLYKVPMNALHINGGYLYVATEGTYWNGIYKTEYDKGYFAGESDHAFLHYRNRVRFFNIIREGNDDYLYSVIEGQVTRVSLATGEEKVVTNFKDRIVTFIYEAGDYLCLVTPKGIVPIKRNFADAKRIEIYQAVLENIKTLYNFGNHMYACTDIEIFKMPKSNFIEEASSGVVIYNEVSKAKEL